MKLVEKALEKVNHETPVVQAFRIAIYRKEGNH